MHSLRSVLCTLHSSLITRCVPAPPTGGTSRTLSRAKSRETGNGPMCEATESSPSGASLTLHSSLLTRWLPAPTTGGTGLRAGNRPVYRSQSAESYGCTYCQIIYLISLICIISALLSSRVSAAETVPAGPGTGAWQSVDHPALADGCIINIAQDAKGHLWAGTMQGKLLRFDGRAWEAFAEFDVEAGRPDLRLMPVLISRVGEIWVGIPGGGVGRYNHESKKWMTYTGAKAPPGNPFLLLEDNSGSIWITTSEGVARCPPDYSDKVEWKIFTTADGLPSTNIRGISVDRSGRIWVGTKRGPAYFDGERWTPFDRSEDLAGRVNHVLEDEDGVFWFTRARSVTRYDPAIDGAAAFRTFKEGDGLGAGQVVLATQDSRGDIWFSTTGGGFSRFDGREFRKFDTTNSPLVQWTWSALEDADGVLWLATRRGIVRYDPSITVFTEEDGLSLDFVWPVFEDSKGDIWVGNWGSGNGSLMRYNGSHFTHYNRSDGPLNSWIWSIIEDRDGNVWLGTLGGLSRFDGERFWRASREQLQASWVFSLIEDRLGRIWAGTSHGIRIYEDGKFTALTGSTDIPGASGQHRVSTLVEDDNGNVWAGTWDGVFRWDGESLTHFTEGDGLAHRVVWSACQDRGGSLWFGTEKGLSRYDPESRTWRTFTREDGLSSERIDAIIEDRDGNLWFGTKGGGVVRYDGRTFQSMSIRDGLPSNHINGVLQDRRGDYWFTTEKGLVRYRPLPPREPEIVVSAVVADRRYEEISDVGVPSTVELVTFEFYGTSLKTQPGGMVYRYRLVGHEDTWRQTREEEIAYEGLPHGSYSFEVVAVDRDMGYSVSPAVVALTVHWPYERAGWLSALGIAVLLVGWQTVRVVRRDQRLQSANEALSDANNELFKVNAELKGANDEIQHATKMKSQFLATMSHELRTPMNAILGFTRLVIRRAGDVLPERQKGNLEKVNQSANHLLMLINDVLDLSKIEAGRFDIKPTDFHAGDLLIGCCSTISPLVKSNVELVCERDGIGQAHTDADRLRQILINLLSNATKFTEEGEIRAEGLHEGDNLVFKVSDSGIGIAEDQVATIFEEFRQVDGSDTRKYQGTGLGLSIAKKLTELLGGTISVESTEGQGSTFTVCVPSTYAGPNG